MVLLHLPGSTYLNETVETGDKLFIYNNLDAGIFSFSSFPTASFIFINTLESFKGVDIGGNSGLCSKATKDLAPSSDRT